MDLIQRNVGPLYQNVTFGWWPLEMRLGGRCRRAWLWLPGYYCLTYGLEPDYDQRVVAEWGMLALVRPETEAEQEERELAELEDWIERDWNEAALEAYR